MNHGSIGMNMSTRDTLIQKRVGIEGHVLEAE